MDAMASVRFILVLLVAFVALAAVCDALVLCPQFPSCCASRSCGPLCPSCREARAFTNGVRNRPTGRSPEISFIRGDPFAFPGNGVFPDPLVLL
ncbi:hypothetical protein SK128_012539 [Halocaridina rubra]|uniref:Uncharacterized protein n=1 Tax=Halocaridina rubra TaxID=373956 RepID=A0AAN8WPX8_HALRR